MKTSLSIIFLLSLFLPNAVFAQVLLPTPVSSPKPSPSPTKSVKATVLPTKSPVLNVVPSVTPTLPASLLETTPQTTAKAASKVAVVVTPSPVTFNKVLSSMPKASFVVLLVVLLVIIVELYIIRSKKKQEEAIPRVTPGASSENTVQAQPSSFATAAGGSLKTRNILALLILLFILIAIPLTMLLVKQRQEIRKKAAEEGTSGQPCRATDPKCNSGLSCVDNVCKINSDTDVGGCCDGDSDQENPPNNLCRKWERCDIPNGACVSGKSCRSTVGCAQDSDCGPGRKCVDGNCQGVGQATIQCSASSGGVRVFCDSCGDSDSFNVSISYFLARREMEHSPAGKSQCFANPFAGGAETTVDKIISKTSEWSQGFSVPTCGVWQTDVTVNYNGSQVCKRSDHGCSWNDSLCGAVTTPTPTPHITPPPTTPPPTTPPPTTPPPTTPPPSGQQISCNQGPCNVAGVSCGSGLVCIHDTWFGHDQWVCRNNDCQIEQDCNCKQAAGPTPVPTSPPVGGPVAPPAPPTSPIPVIPQAGIDTPTIMTAAFGALLLIVGLGLAL